MSNSLHDRSSRTTPCDLCGDREFEIVGKRDRRGHELHTVVCRSCGLVAHERMPTEAELADYYASHYRLDYHQEIKPSAHRILRAWDGGQWLLNLLRPYVRPGSLVCEIGAGIGCTVKAFEQAGFNAMGIEPGLGFQQYGQQVLGARIELQSLEDLPREPQFDFVLLVHVLEHFRSPREALLQVRSLLRPGGRLYVECPNLAGPHSAPSRLFHFAHVHNFTPDTMEMLAESCGLEVVAQLTAPRDRTVRYVFTTRSRAELAIRPESYARSCEAIRRYNGLTYTLRWNYLRERFAREVRFLANHCLASWRLKRLLAQLRSPQAEVPATSDALASRA